MACHFTMLVTGSFRWIHGLPFHCYWLAVSSEYMACHFTVIDWQFQVNTWLAISLLLTGSFKWIHGLPFHYVVDWQCQMNTWLTISWCWLAVSSECMTYHFMLLTGSMKWMHGLPFLDVADWMCQGWLTSFLSVPVVTGHIPVAAASAWCHAWST